MRGRRTEYGFRRIRHGGDGEDTIHRIVCDILAGPQLGAGPHDDRIQRREREDHRCACRRLGRTRRCDTSGDRGYRLDACHAEYDRHRTVRRG